MSTIKKASVLLPIPTEGPYSYRVPEGMEVEPGDLVQVPLGPRQVAAAVWDGDASDIDPEKLRPISHRFECAPLTIQMRRFIEWVARYTLSPPGMVLKMVLRVPAALDPPKPQVGLVFTGLHPDRETKARTAVMEFADGKLIWSRSGLAHAAGVTSSVISGLLKQGVLATAAMPFVPLFPEPSLEPAKVELTEEQNNAAKILSSSVEKSEFDVTLLEGVTGSGKTEVYFEALAACFKQGKQALVLLPEIALTTSFLERFDQRFHTKPAQWHSDMTPKAREQTWRQVASGDLKVVAGARSALYLPFNNLGLIIVDEEHDLAYKQEDRVHYNARDMAVVRAQISGVPIILCSATPSIESRVNADNGKYNHLKLANRYGNADLPELDVVDMRINPPASGRFISPVTTEAISRTLEAGEQALLFLNRRGYAPLTLCRVCGHRFECNNCSAWLVEHRFRQVLQCHHCGDSVPAPEACPHCGTLDHLVACGPGVERLAEEVLNLFPNSRTIILSSDMAGGVKRMRLELEAITRGEADIVIGTQLVAKGHHFPMMTFVGVIDADLGLSNGDPRAAERTFQLLRQVTGRAGRSGGKSRGLLQSYQPDHPVLQSILSADPENFYTREIVERRQAMLPPFGRLAAIIISATDRSIAFDYAREFRKVCPAIDQVRVLGPAEAPLALVRSRYRFRLLAHSARNFNIQEWLRSWLSVAPKMHGSLRMQVDIDPQSFV